ncbi:hypothetical protein [Natrialbaceae archaeon AArc-T1-2]|uniref:hypothetical protein n=1 Tax=Natrialbaceae archaeon AArc-T1-2 TaxID=3053904 RepID=UPI00255B311B|nr:hypothetical protein [Natrialbaceae archaeon AArc-T1-2]WIV68625.1 hypothetical protein QQ977_07855 [Natrialbaceae archaeon AArc-T1-2]
MGNSSGRNRKLALVSAIVVGGATVLFVVGATVLASATATPAETEPFATSTFVVGVVVSTTGALGVAIALPATILFWRRHETTERVHSSRQSR